MCAERDDKQRSVCVVLCDMAKMIDRLELKIPSRISSNYVRWPKRSIDSNTVIFFRTTYAISKTSPYLAVRKKSGNIYKWHITQERIQRTYEMKGTVLTGKNIGVEHECMENREDCLRNSRSRGRRETQRVLPKPSFIERRWKTIPPTELIL